MWQGIRGHDGIVERFRETLRAGRLATTYLFVGPEGIGKSAFAMKLAQSLLCTGSKESELYPCGSCESCRLMAGGAHPDLNMVRPEPGKKWLAIKQFIGEKEMRNREGLCHDIGMRPMLGRRRVAIIEDADWFTTEAANCLLKTLEEPPPGAVIILIGTSRSRQLPTILSRSQVIRFDPLPETEMRELILAEGLVADQSAADELARRSGGSMARARELADAQLWQFRDRLAAQWRAGQINPVGIAKELMDYIDGAGKDADSRRQCFRRLLHAFSEVVRGELRRTGDSIGAAETALTALDRCVEAEQQLDRNANLATLLEAWLDDLAALHAPIGAT
jgi:DNA polymerase-3 subunit delta'